MSSLRPQKISMALAFFALCVLALPAKAGLIAHYTFDDDTNSTTLGLDSESSNYDLTPSGSPDGVPGLFGNAVDTTDGFLYFTSGGANNPDFQPSAGTPTGEFAISFWYKRNPGGSGVPVGRGDIGPISGSPNSGFAALVVDGPANPTFAAANKDKIFQLSNGYDPTNSTPATHAATLPAADSSAFQHVVIQRITDGSDLKLQMWLNGVQIGSGVIDNTTTSLDTGLSLSVGADIIRASDGFNYGDSGVGITDVPDSLNFAGLVDDLQVYDMGLSPSEIADIFNSQPPGPGGGSGGIPEPSSFVLLVLGMMGLARVRRRRR